MIKKLNLSDFLIISESSFTINKEASSFSYPLSSFIKDLSNHDGSFLVNNKKYTRCLCSDYSAYFYDGQASPFMCVFDSLIDIKQRDASFYLFSEEITEDPILIILQEL